jgi:hypothetical protein
MTGNTSADGEHSDVATFALCDTHQCEAAYHEISHQAVPCVFVRCAVDRVIGGQDLLKRVQMATIEHLKDTIT